MPRDYRASAFDGWLRLTFPWGRVEAEGAFLTASVEQASLVPGVLLRDPVKSRQLASRPVAAATFGWLDLHRQVRVSGTIERVADAESDDYFASRPRGSQIGAWASPQSQPIASRAELDDLVAQVEHRFGERPVPRPPHWGGWRLRPTTWEFWQGRSSRLHDRLAYRPAPQGWEIIRLAP